MKLYNTLTRKIDTFKPLNKKGVRVYSCGPTVYDHIHIGNLSAFITADILRRTLRALGHNVHHVMNFTDVDDKTIRRSLERYPDSAPDEALKKLTEEYSEVFLQDMKAIGNDTNSMQFIKATENIEGIRKLITKLHKEGFAYITDDGVYFSITKYQASGKKYGQLLPLNSQNTGNARIDNDEYDKEFVHDFALWKTKKAGEPTWEFNLDGHKLSGRPGWHIECSVMSTSLLGQPFDIHTGGIDLIFPHHENEIAQSTATQTDPLYATLFVHNEHLLVEGKKMSKSLNNFFTLRDIQEKGYDPLAFRLMILQAHYRSQTNFSWDNLDAAQNRLKALRATAALRWQAKTGLNDASTVVLKEVPNELSALMAHDLDTSKTLAYLSYVINQLDTVLIDQDETNQFNNIHDFTAMLSFIDDLLGLDLMAVEDITKKQKTILVSRDKARHEKNWTASDDLRHSLNEQGIGVRDTAYGQIWFRT